MRLPTSDQYELASYLAPFATSQLLQFISQICAYKGAGKSWTTSVPDERSSVGNSVV